MFNLFLENKDKYSFFGNIPFYMEQTKEPEILGLINRTQSTPNDPLSVLQGLLQGNRVYFTGSVESDVIAEMLNPHKFAILDDKYLLSPYIFYVSQKFALKKPLIHL